MPFIDQALIFAQAGDGGSGCCAFRREKFIPKGGPDGGDGGRGGHVYAFGERSCNTLFNFRHRQHYTAQHGKAGRGAKQHGKNGVDCTLIVPLGTTIAILPEHLPTDRVNPEQTTPLASVDITTTEKMLLLTGGKGGRGNAHFATATNQAPRHYEIGHAGQKQWLHLELKLLADVGLVGLPNSGKSTLVSTLSRSRPKIADYPFTTLTPHLGVVNTFEYNSFVIADIPGIIHGAHQGVGLGLQFLKHIRRAAFLLWLLPLDENVEGLLTHYHTLQAELGAYSQTLLNKPRAIILTKSDLLPAETVRAHQSRFEMLQERCFPISAQNRTGLDALVAFLHHALSANTI